MVTLPRHPALGPAASALAALSLLLLSCGDDGGGKKPAEEGDVVEVEYELFPTTKPLVEADLAGLVAVSEDLAIFEFAAPHSALVASLQSRDVILGGITEHTPRGFLRAVHHVEPLPDGGLRVVTVETSPAWAFRKLDLHVRHTLEDATGPGAVTGALRQPLELEHEVEFDEVVFDGDDDHDTVDDQIRVKGHVTPRIRFDLVIDIDWPDSVWDVLVPIDPFDPTELPMDIEVTATLDTTSGVDAAIQMFGAAGLQYDKDLSFGPWVIGTIPAPYPVFFITVELDVDVEIEGGASSSFDVALAGDSGDFGFHVVTSTDEDVEEEVRPILPDPSFEATPPSIDARARASLRAGPRISALAWALVGPRVGLTALASIDADNLRPVCWTLDAGFDAEVGLKVRPVLEKTWPIPLKRWTLDTGDCVLPPEAGTDVNPTFTPWAKAYADMVNIGGEWTDLTLVTDGRWLVAADTGRSLAKVTAEGELVWAKEYDRIHPLGGHREPLWIQHVEPTRSAELIAAAHPPTFLSLDMAGKVRWARAASLVEHGRPRLNGGIVELDDGTFLAASTFEPAEDADDDVVLLRIAPDGTLLDARTWGDAAHEEIPMAIARWGTGWVVLGRSEAPAGVAKPGWMLELDAAGELRRSFRIARGDGRVNLDAARALEDGGLLLAGSVDRPGGQAAFLVKLREDRSVAWQRSLDTGAGFGLRLNSVTQNPLGYLIAAGTLDDYFEDTWITGLDNAGRVMWARVIDGDGGAVEAPAIAATEDHGVLVAAQLHLTQPAGYFLAKVWRKDGQVVFRDGQDIVQRELPIAEGDPGLEVVPGPVDLAEVHVPWLATEVLVGTPDGVGQVDLAP